MKTIHILLLVLLCGPIWSQTVSEKSVKTKVDEVTVFLDGAQIVRKKAVDLPKGETLLKFTDLSPFIEAKSVQVKAEGNLMVLSVNHQQNYLEEMEKSDELTYLEKQLKILEDNIELENTHLAIIKEELSFLQENRAIGGKNEQVSVSGLQQASEFYGRKLTSLKMKEIERANTLKSFNEQRADLENQISAQTSQRKYPTGEILVKVDAKQPGTFSLELIYLVGNTGWFPSYDIRAKNIDEPVRLVYKANVKQDTKVDWNGVNLKFSSGDPNVSGVAPELQTYLLDYNTLPPDYKLTTGSVRGKVTDRRGEPLPGVNIVVTGTTVGSVTDFDGNYSISIPKNSTQLTFSYIGYETLTQSITSSVMNIVLDESQVLLEEVVVTGYGAKERSKKLQGRALGLNMDDSSLKSSLAIPTVQVENQTTVDFEIKTPYTIRSDNKSYTVDMESYELPASFQYYCVPKIDRDAFLIARIVDWEKYNLLEGEANVFFEDTYVGKSLLDVRYASDTLEISMGRDKKVAVNREKLKDFTTKQFIGNKKEETRTWKTTVKNNKTRPISMVVLDQVPVSTLEEIEVNVQKTSGARQNQETGEIRWEFELRPNAEKELELKYTVKYPKNRNLIVE